MLSLDRSIGIGLLPLDGVLGFLCSALAGHPRVEGVPLAQLLALLDGVGQLVVGGLGEEGHEDAGSDHKSTHDAQVQWNRVG